MCAYNNQDSLIVIINYYLMSRGKWSRCISFLLKFNGLLIFRGIILAKLFDREKYVLSQERDINLYSLLYLVFHSLKL